MSSKPVRIQRKRVKGYRMQEHSRAVNGLPAVSVTRPGKWGNPFKVERPDDCFGWVVEDKHFTKKREAASYSVSLFSKWLAGQTSAAMSRELLRGKNLACFCSEGDPCHADVLLEWANGEVLK